MAYNGSMVLKDLDVLIENYYVHYDSVGRVWCAILNSYVHFTAEGRLHLLYKTNRKKRNVNEQRYKLNLFPLVVPVLKKSDNIQNWRFPESASDRDVQFYAVVGEAGRQKLMLQVIVKRAEDGQFNFHSVMIHDPKSIKKPRRKDKVN